MSTFFEQVRAIEEELHNLETATPRNSATVDRGGLQVVDEGSILVEQGGTVFFREGGSAISDDFSIESGKGWQIGTERRGSSVVVLKDIPGADLTVTTANSSVKYEEVLLVPDETYTVLLGESSTMIVQVFHVSEATGSLKIAGETVRPNEVIKSQKTQWAYSYMGYSDTDVDLLTALEGVQVRIARLSVNNAA